MPHKPQPLLRWDIYLARAKAKPRGILRRRTLAAGANPNYLAG